MEKKETEKARKTERERERINLKMCTIRDS
jgi:hypothetical protein